MRNMLKPGLALTALRCTVLVVLLFIGHQAVSSQDQYESQVLFTIPWGDEPGHLTLLWHEPLPPDFEGYYDAPFPVSFSPTGGLAVVEYDGSLFRLIKFSPDGELIGDIDLESVGVREYPGDSCVAIGGEVMLVGGDFACVLAADLSPIEVTTLPWRGSYVGGIWPSATGGFWVVYDSPSWVSAQSGEYEMERMVVEYSLENGFADPTILFHGTREDPERFLYYFVTPDGTVTEDIQDMYGYSYMRRPGDQCSQLVKMAPNGQQIYANQLVDDPSWEGFVEADVTHNYFIDWSGDFYTLQATGDGAVLTKYTLVAE